MRLPFDDDLILCLRALYLKKNDTALIYLAAINNGYVPRNVGDTLNNRQVGGHLSLMVATKKSCRLMGQH